MPSLAVEENPMNGLRLFVPRRAICSHLLAAAILLATPAVCMAIGSVRISWDQCNPYVGLKCAADIPTDAILKQVISIAGEGRSNYGHLTFIRVGPNTPDAWRFDADGCVSGLEPGLLTASTAPFDAGTCPAFRSTLEGPGYAVTFDSRANFLTLELSNVYVTPFIPDAAKRYTMWQIEYDLRASYSLRPGDPHYCDGIGDGVSFLIAPNPKLVLDVGVFGDLYLEAACVAWNHSSCSSDVDPCCGIFGSCPVQTGPVTWGRIKSYYR
jgi:hypothetical protein